MTAATKEKSGITFIAILVITVILCTFIFLVTANITGSVLTAVLGIGKACTKC
jgi:hypothetical protein